MIIKTKQYNTDKKIDMILNLEKKFINRWETKIWSKRSWKYNYYLRSSVIEKLFHYGPKSAKEIQFDLIENILVLKEKWMIKNCELFYKRICCL